MTIDKVEEKKVPLTIPTENKPTILREWVFVNDRNVIIYILRLVISQAEDLY